MNTYFLSIITTSIIVALSEMILPNGKLKSVVNTVFSIAILFTIVSTIVGISENDFDFSFNNTDSGQKNENVEYVADFFDNSIKEYYQKFFADKLKENDLIAERVEVEICNMKIEKVYVFLSNLVIPNENAHINNNVIKNYVSKVLNLAENQIELYV